MNSFWDKVIAMRKSGRQLVKQKEESAPVVDAVPAPEESAGKKKKASAKLKVETEIKLDTENFDASEMVVLANDCGTDKES